MDFTPVRVQRPVALDRPGTALESTSPGIEETVRFDALVARKTAAGPGGSDSTNWDNLGLFTDVKLAPGATASEVPPQIKTLVTSNTPPDFALPHFRQPLTDLHFDPGFGGAL